MKSCESLFLTALESFHQGKQQEPVLSAAASGLGFDLLLDSEISSRLPIEEQLRARFAAGIRSRGLLAARSGRLIEAQQALKETKRIRQSNGLSAEAKLMIETFDEAVGAYVEYRQSDYSQARSRVYRAMAIDGELITNYGYDILDLHRVQLGHNLMRIDAHCGNMVEAAEMCASLLAYLEGDVEHWPLAEFLIQTNPSRLPPELLKAMFIQIVGELALMLGGRKGDEACRMFAAILPHVENRATANCRQFLRVHRWLEAKWAYINGEVIPFLEHIIELLRDGPGEMLLLWRVAAVDLRSLCYEVGSNRGARALREIDHECQAWSHVPPQLRRRLSFAEAV